MPRILLDRLEGQLAGKVFIAGQRFSITDMTGYFTVNFTNTLAADVEVCYLNIFGWHGEFSQHCSTQGGAP